MRIFIFKYERERHIYTYIHAYIHIHATRVNDNFVQKRRRKKKKRRICESTLLIKSLENIVQFEFLINLVIYISVFEIFRGYV